MMVSLFSIFDPSIYLLSPWVLVLVLLILLSFYWRLVGFNHLIFMSMYKSLMIEVSAAVGEEKKKGLTLFLLSLFFTLFIYNFSALYPSVFTVTAHMLLAFSYAIYFWLSLMIILLLFNFRGFLVHLLPLGTPLVLMPFMILVELVSALIRPITLSVRLVANMVAGHLLMSLLGGFMLIQGSLSFLLVFPVSSVLTVLELGVSFIQAYVFIVLLSLYSQEIH